MDVELKAEYEWLTVLLWHIVPTGDSKAFCGRLLAPNAETKPIPAAANGEVCVRCTAEHVVTPPRG